ncbi:MAG: DNA polymerase III subunit beta [Dehalococcoidales bacterium]|nr:DNA polymerase III subunit beta [Dehalococcoidales bacterium]
MKLSCTKEKLDWGLGVVGKAVATRTTLPITQNILMSAEDGDLVLTATNLEMALVCRIGSDVKEKGAITIPARLFSEFIGSLSNDVVSMELLPASRSLEVKCGRSDARFSGVDAKEFPPVPHIDDTFIARVEAEALFHGLSRVVFAASDNDSRPVLTGVNAVFAGKTLTLAAADGFRLSVASCELKENSRRDTNIIIPAKTLVTVMSLIGNQEETIDIAVDTKTSQVLFHIGKIELVSQLVSGTFPNYAQLIPQGYVTKVNVDRGELWRAVKAVAGFSQGYTAIVRLKVIAGKEGNPGQMVIAGQDADIGDAVGEIDAVVEGEATRIAFDGKLLMGVLSELKVASLSLELNSPSSPGVIRVVGENNFTHVLMPMFVQW